MKEPKNLTLAAYDRIKEMMLNYDIVPGQRLVFMDLARQLGVSRTPVNNALSMLAKEGYLDFVPHQGYSVHKLTQKELEEIYEIREILEIGTIGKAIRRMTQEKLDRVARRKAEYEAAITDRVHRQLFVLDTEFHAGIIDMIDNDYLVERYREICRKIFLRFRTEHLRMTRIQEIVEEHNRLFEAIRIKDVDRAKELIRGHNTNAQQNLFSIIFQDEEDGGKIKPPPAAVDAASFPA